MPRPRYVMIGAPVTTVRTPPLLEARLAERGVPAEVSTRHVEPSGLASFVAAVRADATVHGLLVTMPHKRAIVAMLDALTERAAAAGSVNAVRRLPDGRLIGAQFDGIALLRAVVRRGFDPAGARVLLAGLGGAGLAIARELLAAGCRVLAVTEIDPLRRRRGLARLTGEFGAAVRSYEEAAGSAFDLLVNATPLGMSPGDPSPFGDRLIAAAKLVADIVADPPATRLAGRVRALRRPLVTGRAMVCAQIGPIADWLCGPDPVRSA